MNLPALPQESTVEEEGDELQQHFYTAAMAHGSSGSPELDLLLQKGLYGAKTPAALKSKKATDAFQTAFDLIGGIPRLALWADKNPTAFYGLFSKLIPSTVKGDIHHKIEVIAPWMNPNRLSYRDAANTVDVEAKKVPDA